MRVEVPTLKRCCFCMPLRRGLLLWAYILLIVCFLQFAVVAQTLHACSVYTNSTDRPNGVIAIQSLRLIFYIPDIALTIMFIYGAHTKNYKLFRIYYFWTVIITIILFVYRVSTTIWYLVRFEMGLRFSVYWIAISTIINVIALGMQVYMILMLRSEMIKLGENCAFRFFNSGAEAECRLNTKHDGASSSRVRDREVEIDL